jgi:phosphocarrier protein HPr
LLKTLWVSCTITPWLLPEYLEKQQKIWLGQERKAKIVDAFLQSAYNNTNTRQLDQFGADSWTNPSAGRQMVLFMDTFRLWKQRGIEMFVKEVAVQNQVGLHARPATFFIQKANEYKSSIWVEKEERRVNAKSLLGVLSLGIVGGTSIRIIADGSDEQAAVEGLVKLVESGFTE